jgi:hypothetical protein
MLNEIDWVTLQIGCTMRVCMLNPSAYVWTEQVTYFTEHCFCRPFSCV